MLDKLIAEDLIQAHAVVGIHPCRRQGDDIVVDGPVNGHMRSTTFYGLRQQQDTDQDNCACLSDFVAPQDDHLGGFACTCGVGVDALKAQYDKSGEVDQAILVDAVADRLTEAFAELLHVKVRKELWGYAPDEDLSLDDMLKVKYQGIRPAPGYPTQPDHREKVSLFDLLQVEELLDGSLGLTESHMMLPAAAVSALCFAHPDAQYFNVGQINRDQVQDYAARRGDALAETERWLGSSTLGYDP